ncbi:MAG: ParB N-terminal domain-containing protein, partial [Bacteroidota bacterium]
VIKEELKNLIPPLAQDEFEKLEDNILAEGCRDALIVWKHEGSYILIDGHNRHNICTKHGLPFRVEVMEFENIDQVSDWMVNNQLGKRNVTEETKSYLRGLQYNREKKKVGGTGANQHSKQLGHNVPTAERLAKQHKVSEKTIKRDEKFAIAIDKITSNNKSLKWDILNKKINMPKVATLKLADESDEIAQKIGEYIYSGASFKQALDQAREKPAEEDPNTNQIKQLKSNIATTISEAIKLRNLDSLGEAKRMIEELEELLKQ